MKNKIISLIVAILTIFSVSVFSGCNNKEIIGIIQFGTHGSLNNCYTGIIKGLEESDIDLSKYKIETLNSNFSAEMSLSQANTLVNKKAKVIIGIATPSAIQAATAATGKNIPVVYCAVTDNSTMNNFENITGTSDIPDFDAQLKIVTEFMGRSDLNIGVLMSTEESSDKLQLSMIKESARSYENMTIIDKTVADITTIEAHVNALVSEKVDCIVNLLDNTIVGKLDTILSITNQAKIPVFGSEIEQVKSGCLASASIDYITVGKYSGEQAAEILKGKSASDVATRTMQNSTFPCYNSEVLATFTTLVKPDTISGLKDVLAK